MKKRVVSITLVLVLLLGAGAVATYALAGDWGRRGYGMHGMHGGKRSGHGMMRMLRTLELSDEQKAKIGVAMMEARKKSIVARAQLRVARMELHDALFQDSIDEAAVSQLRDQITGLQGELLDLRIATQQSIHTVLTPEQRGKARTMFLERMVDRSEGRFHGGGKGPHGRGYGRFHGDGEGPRGRGHGRQ